MDRDYDGRLSFEEFMGEECTIEKLFKNMDKNNDGYISKQVGTSFSKEKLQTQINFTPSISPSHLQALNKSRFVTTVKYEFYSLNLPITINQNHRFKNVERFKFV